MAAAFHDGRLNDFEGINRQIIQQGVGLTDMASGFCGMSLLHSGILLVKQ